MLNQAELLMRAYAYTTGKMWHSKSYMVLSCAWIYVYPFISGELNWTITGLGFGIRDRKVLPPGLILITIPHDHIPMIIENLNDMKWDLQGPGLTAPSESVQTLLTLDNRELKSGNSCAAFS